MIQAEIERIYEERIARWKGIAIKYAVITVIEAACIIALAVNNLMQ